MDIFQYYGIDLFGMTMILSSIYVIGSKKRFGFILGVIANLSWLIFGAMVNSTPTMITNMILVVLNVRGYLNWNRK